PVQLPGVVTSETSITDGFGSHKSLAVGAVNTGAAGQSIVASAPCPLMSGGVTSTTVIVCATTEDSLPQASTAFHVLVLVYVPVQLPGVVTSETSITDGFGSHKSLAVGAVNTGEAGQSIVASAPCPLMSGGVTSTTVMVCATTEDSLPQASTAFHVLVLVYVPVQLPGVVTSETSITDGFGSHKS